MEPSELAQSVEAFAQLLLVGPSTAAVVAGVASMVVLAVGGVWAVRPR